MGYKLTKQIEEDIIAFAQRCNVNDLGEEISAALRAEIDRDGTVFYEKI